MNSIPQPAIPDLDLLRDQGRFYTTPDGGLSLAYDTHSLTGLMYDTNSRRWGITTHITFTEWVQLLVRVGGIRLPESEEVSRWVCACSDLVLRKPN